MKGHKNMIKHRILNIRILILVLMSLLTSMAQAAITSVSATNSPSQLSVASSGFSQISWSVIENGGGNGAGTLTISSPSGLFRAPNGSVLGTVAQGLQQTVNVPPGLTTYLFSESLTIPQTILQQALQAGFSSITYERGFSDGSAGPTSSVSFTITGSQISQVSVSNVPSQVAITATSHSQVNWSLGLIGASGTTVTINSGSGVFRAPDGSTLGTVNRSLQTTRILSNGSTTVAINESLTIPQSVIRQAQKKGYGRFSYTRQFTNGQSNGVATATFSITGGGAAGELSIRRVQMEYDDGRITAVIAPQSKLRARAVISYNGTGLLEYSWEVASPPSTQGQPIFVPLISRKQYLLAGDQVVLQTPTLPTGDNGNYLVRLRIEKPVANFRLPVLRYAVNRSGQVRAETRIAPLPVIRPAPNAVLAPDTLFAWQPVVAANAYQLEIYTRPVRNTNLPGARQQAPITGILVPAAKTRITVGSLSRTHLLSGSTYYWRVVAMSTRGRVIARSNFRRIHFQ